MMRAIQILLLAAMAVSASAAATEAPAVDCVKATQPTLKETIGSDDTTFAWNPDSVTITTQDSETVTFEVSQLWVEDGTPMFSVHYRSITGEEICDEVQDAEQVLVTTGFKKSYTAQCTDGVAEVSIYMYVGDNNIDVAECESCTAPSVDYCGHYITIPCVDVPECTSVPSSAPTDPVEAVAVPRDDCYSSVVEMAEQAGNTTYYDYKNPINVIDMGLDSVTVEVTQVFSEKGVGMLAVSYEEVDFGSNCEMQTLVSFETSISITAQCINGFAEMAVYLSTGEMLGFDETKCEACKLTNEEEYVAYYYVVPCIPTCKPEIPDCFTGALTVLADIGNDDNQHHCIYGDMPVKLSETDAGPDAVAFYLQDTWPGSTGSVSISYTNQEQETVCDAYSSDMFKAEEELTASCNDDDTATIVVTLNDSEITHNANQIDANTCTVFTEGGTCSYEVVLPCDSMKMCAGEETDSPTESPTTLSTTAFPTQGPTSFPSANPSDGPTGTPTKEPTGSPTGTPTDKPSDGPTGTPTKEPTGSPTGTPTDKPSDSPTGTPTKEPTGSPSGTPTKEPTTSPTASPTLSMAPTDCMEFKEPQVINTMCFNGNEEMKNPIVMPSGTVAISALIGETVNVLINSPFDKEAAAIAVKHDDSGLESSCDVHSPISSAIEFNAACVKDMASTTIIVYYDNEFSASECDACDAKKEDGYNGVYCAYNIEMSCESTSVACGEPSASPSGSFYPSLAPSESPTKSAAPTSSPTDSPSDGPTSNPTSNPTASPTSNPTDSPTLNPTDNPTLNPTDNPTSNPTVSPTLNPTTSMAPTGCTERGEIAVSNSMCYDSNGLMDETADLPEEALIINSEDGDTVSFTISPEFREAAAAIAIRYHNEGYESTCDYNMDLETLFDIDSARCFFGNASATISVFFEGPPNVAECDACSIEKYPPTTKYCVYVVSIPCVPNSVECGEPSSAPSRSPTPDPTTTPSAGPTDVPTPSPSASPSDSPTSKPTDSPTNNPTDSPTDKPTPSPTDSPSNNPTDSPTAYPTVSTQPTDCYEYKAPDITAHECFNMDLESMPEGAVIYGGTGDNVDVTVTPKWDSPVTITYTHEDETNGITCGVMKASDLEDEFKFDAGCINNMASTTIIVVHEQNFNTADCDACDVAALKDSGVEFCAYTMEMSCESTSVACGEPSASPSGSFYPSLAPSESPTKSAAPTSSPTDSPSDGPTSNPTSNPTASPTSNPTDSPTLNPTDSPTSNPTASPSSNPTASPTLNPTDSPTSNPTASPSSNPTASPTSNPTASPSSNPTASPTSNPTASPSSNPTASPSSNPTASPSSNPTASPSSNPTASPTISPTASPTLSMAPTDCMEFKEPQVITTMCFNGNKEMEDPIVMPSGTVAISALIGETVNVLINGPFKDAEAIAVKHDDSGLESSCDVHSPISSAIEFNAACVKDMASTTIIVYYDNEFSASECDACDAKKEDGYNGVYCAYNIEMSCESTSVACGEPSASPSGSFYPSLAPSESPTKSAAPTSSPTDSPSDGPTSNPTSNPTASPTSTPTSAPTGSPTSSPTGSPSSGPSGSPTSAPTGSPSSGPSESPTSAPTGSPSSGPTVKPTSAPTGSPSFVPTATPTAGPTTNPTVSMEPSNCVGFKAPFIESKCMTTSGDVMATQPLTAADMTIEVVDGTVSISISETWTNNALDQIGLAYRIDGDGTCVTYGNVTAGETVDIMATCISGSAGLTVVAHLSNEFNPAQCDACNAGDLASLGGSDVFCSYHIEIPCETMDVPCGEPSASPSGSFYPSLAPSESPTVSMSPTASPTTSPSTSPSSSPSDSPTASPTTSPSTSPSSSLAPSSSPSCPRDPAKLISSEGDTDYDHMPITITFQNGTHVEFEVENTFDQNITIFTERHSGHFGETECLQEENFGTDDPLTFTATCMHNVKISIVNLWVMECVIGDPVYLQSGDNAEIPECCHAPQDCKVVQYTFKLPCEEPVCPESQTSQRRLADAHSLISEKKAEVASTAEFEELTGHADPSDVDDHFCVIEDYPCGTSLDKVHVCHYSARDGYKTFCVPEADSDALRFYPKDYCGPCVGGYSNA